MKLGGYNLPRLWPGRRQRPAEPPPLAFQRPGLSASLKRAGSSRERTRPGRPGSRPPWWRANLSGQGILYGDDALWSILEEFRRSAPLVDRGIRTLVQLMGDLKVDGPKSGVLEFNEWRERVKVNQCQRSLRTWLRAYVDGMLLYGKGVGEWVPTRSGRDVAALVNLDPRSVVFRETKDPLTLDVLQRTRMGREYLELDPNRTLISVGEGEAGSPHGFSIYHACPYVLKVQRVIENATAQQWLRIGVPPFHINWDPTGENFSDPDGSVSDEVLSELKTEWEAVMTTAKDPDSGQVGDYFTSGKVTAEILGKGGEVLSVEEPFRLFAEQIIGATGLPAWLLGLNWSKTERLASIQAEMVIAGVEALRKSVMAEVEELVETRQALAGKSSRLRLSWLAVNLHDLVEQARANAWEEQAMQRRIANNLLLWECGLIDQARAGFRIDPDLGPIYRPMEVPPPLPGQGPLGTDQVPSEPAGPPDTGGG